MKTRLLILALLAAPLSSRAQTSPAETLARVERAASSWMDWRIRAAQMESDFMDNAIRSSTDARPFAACLSSFDGYETRNVRRVDDWRGVELARWRGEAAAGTLSRDEADRRISYVDRLYRLRMLRFYGNLMPRSIDTCSVGVDGKSNGRLLAGPGWAIAFSEADLKAAEFELVERSGLAAEDAFAR